jgi:hypothetical protein
VKFPLHPISIDQGSISYIPEFHPGLKSPMISTGSVNSSSDLP